MIIAIDGTVASGKSTAAKMLAAQCGYTYINTGLMYRGVAAFARKHAIPTHDVKHMNAVIESLNVTLKNINGTQHVLVNDEDMTEGALAPDIGAYVSDVADNENVRAALVRAQQQLGRTSDNAVMEGRDIGSVVFPDADIKFFVTADLEARAKRRFHDDKARAKDISLDEVIEYVSDRDERDEKRPVGALKKMPDAIEVDTTHLSPDEVVALMISRIEEKK